MRIEDINNIKNRKNIKLLATAKYGCQEKTINVKSACNGLSPRVIYFIRRKRLCE